MMFPGETRRVLKNTREKTDRAPRHRELLQCSNPILRSFAAKDFKVILRKLQQRQNSAYHQATKEHIGVEASFNRLMCRPRHGYVVNTRYRVCRGVLHF
jgi:hypothetical protein